MRLQRHRLSMDIPQPLFEELKKRSSKHNVTMTVYIIRSLIAQFQFEQQYED